MAQSNILYLLLYSMTLDVRLELRTLATRYIVQEAILLELVQQVRLMKTDVKGLPISSHE